MEYLGVGIAFLSCLRVQVGDVLGDAVQFVLVVLEVGDDTARLLHFLHHLLPGDPIHRPGVVGEDGGGEAEVETVQSCPGHTIVLGQTNHHHLGAVLHQPLQTRVAGPLDVGVVEEGGVGVYQRVGSFLDDLGSLGSGEVAVELCSLTALNAVVRPELLFVRRVPPECHLVVHLDVLHRDVGVVLPVGVQRPQAEVGVEGDVVLRVPVLTVEHL